MPGLLDSSRLRLEELARRLGSGTPGGERSPVLRDARLTLGIGDRYISNVAGPVRARRFFVFSQSTARAGENGLFTINVGPPLNVEPADQPLAGLLVTWWVPMPTALSTFTLTMPETGSLIGNSNDDLAESRVMPIGTDPVDQFGDLGAVRDAASGTYPGQAPGNAGMGFTYSCGTTLAAAVANAINYRTVNAGATNRPNEVQTFVPTGRAMQLRANTANLAARFGAYIDWVYAASDLP